MIAPATKSDWLIGMLVAEEQHWFSASPYCVGMVEITRRPEIEPAIVRALAASANAAGLQLKNDVLLARVGVRDATEAEAWRFGRLALTEVLEALTLEGPFGLRGRVLPVGFAFDLRGGRAVPMLPSEAPTSLFGMIGQIDNETTHPLHSLRHILAQHPSQRSELGSNLIRSLHWKELAHGASQVDRFLFSWIALEVLGKSGEGHAVGHRIAASLGLVRDARVLGPAGQSAYRDPRIKKWRRTVLDELEVCRKLRNHIVHAGFREVDALYSGTSYEQHLVLLRQALPRLQHLAVNAIVLGAVSTKDLWGSYFADAFLLGRRGAVTDDLLQNVIPTLATR
jgi:hypothetical protein